MGKLDQLGNASNEKRNQRIMVLRSDFAHRRVVTVNSAVKRYGYRESTVVRWAKDGDIPLITNDGKTTVVPVRQSNAPQWLLEIMKSVVTKGN